MEHSQNPQYGRLLAERSKANDGEALTKARKALVTIEDRRNRYSKKRRFNTLSKSQDSDKSTTSKSIALVNLPLGPIYDDLGDWQAKIEDTSGAKRFKWSGFGYPEDESLIVKDIEKDIVIDEQSYSIIQLPEDLHNIRTRPAYELADESKIVENASSGRRIQTFSLNDRTVAKIMIEDADVLSGRYDKTKTAEQFEKELNKVFEEAVEEAAIKKMEATLDQTISNSEQKKMRDAIKKKARSPPHLDVERYVTAHSLLRLAGKIGVRREDSWRKARNMAQQLLHYSPGLEEIAEQQLKEEMDPSLREMVEIVKGGITTNIFNPYFQAKRDKLAIEKNLFHIVDADITMVLDRNTKVIAFQLSEGMKKVLNQAIHDDIIQAFDVYSTLQPVPLPDGTRHGLHWVEFLRKYAEKDFRNTLNDLRLAKSGVYHYGVDFSTGDPHGEGGMSSKQDSGRRLEGASAHILEQLEKLRYGAFGACTAALSFCFKILDPALYAEYEDVAMEIEKSPNAEIAFKTCRGVDPWSIRAFLVNLMTTEHKDTSDWKFGFAGLVPVGEFTGGDLLLRELGLQIVAPSGCVQLIRGRELRHSISEWEGRRFVVVCVTHDSVRQWGQRRIKGTEVDGQLQQNKGESGHTLHRAKRARMKNRNCGDLLIRQLGLRIEGPSGCAQFMQGKDLFHSITKWTGRRFVVVNATHQAVRVSAENKIQKASLGIALSSDEGRKHAREDSDDYDGGEKRKKAKKSK